MTFPGWHTEANPDTGSDVDVKEFPSGVVVDMVLFVGFLALLFDIIATLWLHTARVGAEVAIRSAYYSAVAVRLGAAPIALGWISVVLIAIGFLMVVVMKLSINLVERLADST